MPSPPTLIRPDRKPAPFHAPSSAPFHAPSSAHLHAPSSAHLHAPSSAHLHAPSRPPWPARLAAAILTISLFGAPAVEAGQAGGDLLLSGNSTGFYDGHEWPELVRSLLTIALLLAEDDWEDDDWDRTPRYCDDLDNPCDVLGITIPQAQFDVGLSYFVFPGLALGARYLFSEDFRDDELTRLWGGGPEATLFFGPDRGQVRPFLGGGLLYTRGRARSTGRLYEKGTSFHLRAGLHIPLGGGAGLVLQGGWRDDLFPRRDPFVPVDPVPPAADGPLTRRVAGFGIGFTARFD